MKVLALDYGSARTGLAVSDPTGSLARPLEVVERAASEDGIARIAAVVQREGAERVVVGLPLTLKGERGPQAVETERFVEALRQRLGVPIETFDERFTTRIARLHRTRSRRAEDSVAAAHLLTGYLTWTSRRPA